MRKLLIPLFLLPLISWGNECLETRASISLNTTYARLVVAEVDKCKSIISKYYLEMGTKVDLVSGTKKNDYLVNQKLEKYALNALKKLAENARDFRPKNLVLVPSKSLKKFKNHLEFLREIKKNLNCKVVLPSLETESILGFLAAKLKMPKGPLPLMVWSLNDSGSFWAIEEEGLGFKIFYDKISPYIFKDMVVEGILKKDHTKILSPNPLDNEKIAQATKLLDTYLKYNLDKFLQEKSANYQVVGIGNFHYQSIYPQANSTVGSYKMDQLKTALEKSTNLPDKEIGGEYPEVQVTNLILAIKTMETMKIEEVTALSVNEADGVLVYEDYWKAN
jgi:hypothetical protein